MLENSMVIGDYYPVERREPDPDEAYDRARQEEIDAELAPVDGKCA